MHIVYKTSGITKFATAGTSGTSRSAPPAVQIWDVPTCFFWGCDSLLGGGKSPFLIGKTMGKPWENGDLYGKSPFLMGKSTISMAMFNSFLSVYQKICQNPHVLNQWGSKILHGHRRKCKSGLLVQRKVQVPPPETCSIQECILMEMIPSTGLAGKSTI